MSIESWGADAHRLHASSVAGGLVSSQVRYLDAFDLLSWSSAKEYWRADSIKHFSITGFPSSSAEVVSAGEQQREEDHGLHQRGHREEERHAQRQQQPLSPPDDYPC